MTYFSPVWPIICITTKNIYIYIYNTYYITYTELIPFSCVGNHMSRQMTFLAETLTTLITWMIFPCCVSSHMSYHMTIPPEALIILVAMVILFSSVGRHMSYQRIFQTEAFTTLIT